MPLISYSIKNMRVVPIAERLRAKYPDRLATVHGEFHSVDAKGKVNPDPLSFSSKVITTDERNAEGFSISLPDGTLTVPAGERGRKAAPGMSADEVAALFSDAESDATDEAASA